MKKLKREGKLKYYDGAVKPRPGEIDDVITGKLVQRFQIQKQLRETYLSRRVKEERLGYFRDILNKELDKGSETVEYEGKVMSFSWAVAEYNLELHYLKNMLSNEQYLRQGLMNVGFNEVQLKQIQLDGKYVTSHVKMKEMEKKYGKT